MVFLRCGESFCVDLDSKSVQISFHKIHKDTVFLLYVFFGVSLKLKAGQISFHKIHKDMVFLPYVFFGV